MTSSRFIALCAGVLLGVLLSPLRGHAAELILVRDGSSGSGGVTVRVVVKPEEPVNALSGELRYDPALLKVEDVNAANSVISLWTRAPAENSEGVIVFAGAIPGGLTPAVAVNAEVFRVRFSTRSAGATSLRMSDLVAYLHGPNAQRDVVRTAPLLLDLTRPASASEPLMLDFSPPEPFVVRLVKSVELMNAASVLVFQTADKGSGVVSYQVRERRFGIWSDWREAQSPMRISGIHLLSAYEIKAVDAVGHEYIARFTPPRLEALWTIGASLGEKIWHIMRSAVRWLRVW
ncbi:MAG: hypothetical protein IT406_03505 [Candidatus Yanofskybacteria bacterium]|nr:hypothetical protein [Candidatus Yanofskybacteria bacterium]